MVCDGCEEEEERTDVRMLEDVGMLEEEDGYVDDGVDVHVRVECEEYVESEDEYVSEWLDVCAERVDG